MRHHAWLYSAVFTGRFSTLLIIFLFASFIVQPFHKAMANTSVEPVVEEVPVVAEDVVLEEPIPEPEVVEDVIGSSNDIPFGENTEDEMVDTIQDDSVAETELPQEESVDTVAEEQATSSEQNIVPVESVVQAQYVITEENYFQFSKNACVAVGDGAFHCSSNTKNELDAQSVVFSQQGASGNMEIFLKTTRGSERQITENSYDDTAPHYDPESMRIVWQRLIDGRYQIILYDIMEERETQLTFSKTNNMEPKVSDAGIVWQAWDNNDWEIMYFDGAYTEQLTSNEAQDVAPVVQDGYVLWSVLGIEDQEARVYSIDTKEIVSITGHDGGSITNPRFVLVYDTEFQNGDTITQSFDPATGLSEAVAARPAPEPIDIPESDPTGEIRALLLQGKQQKDETDDDDLLGTGGPDLVTPPAPDTLNLKSDSTIATTTIVNVSEDFTLTEFDLVIPPSSPKTTE